ncbi:MAG: M56 family metallopeptidase [Erythrobacter sp.]|uniref:M56 family metallopeptidase n=1 Tax=Erythrobacter sp. TaxID=1042 RepID=UPI0032980F4A
MTDWMMETLVWTAVLIAFVLMVRRPVSRAFGPQIAYALWALPAIRLMLPPIELPAWMRILQAEPEQMAVPIAATEAPAIFTPAVFEAPAAREGSAVVAHPAASDTTPPLTQISGFDMTNLDTGLLVELGVTVWLIGAAIFLVSRFSSYFRLRDELLEVGREVGRQGSVRLIETPGTKAPLAFGVIDKVVALPEGFLARPDRQSRDLALSHELAHHKGGDLLANVLVQPLFAIHWWNPLGRYGWLAMRRDQEAACDARVMASARAEEREAYANLIVSFAASPCVALAAPMACPVLGEKSIIHRLRSLKMDQTNTKRRAAGKFMLGAAVVALPMTASISYAASETPLSPAAPKAQIAAAAMPVAPRVPHAPTAPQAPVAPLLEEQIIVIDPDGEVSNIDANGKNVFTLKTEDSDDKTVEFFAKSEFRGSSEIGKERSASSRLAFGNRSNSVRFIDRSELDAEGRLSDKQIEEILVEVREGLEEANKVLEDLPKIIEKAQAEANAARDAAGRSVVRVEASCKSGNKRPVNETEDSDGVKVIEICQKRVMAQALDGLREARRSLKKSDVEGDIRSTALREIDRVISRWESEAR